MSGEPGPIRRRNVLCDPAEPWRPPNFEPQIGARGRVLAVVRRFFDLQAGSIWRDLKPLLSGARGTVVDIGCGAQPYRQLLPADTNYVGLDTHAAREHFGYAMRDTRYFEGERWPVGDGDADVVLCTETLEHVPDPASLLSEARRCLKPGGRIVLTVPFAARWHYAPHDYWRFTPSGLERLLRAAGLADVRVYARGGPLTVACYKSMALILPWLIAPSGSWGRRALLRLAALPFVPLLVVAAGVANLSLLGSGGNDCLGYTAVADKPPA